MSAMNAVLFAIVAGLCWGAGEVCAKAVLHTHKIGPFLAVAIRTSLALPLIWIAYFIARKLAPGVAGKGLATGENAMNAKEWLLLLGGSGVLAGALAMIAFYISISMGEVSRMKPIAFSIAPATAVLLGAAFIHEPLTPRKVLGVVIILAGVIILSTGSVSAKV